MREFRAIPSTDGAYEASNDGIIRSLDRVVMRSDGTPLRVKGRVMRTTVSDRGYERLSIITKGKSRRCGVHQLVAEAWLPKPVRAIGSKRGQFVVNHKDGDKLNNHASNLEYIPAGANVHHARASGLLSVKGVRNPKARLSDGDVRAIRERYSLGETQVSLAAAFGVDQTSISRIIRRDTWRHVV